MDSDPPARRGALAPAGLLLAAGAGRRMGGPKALLHDRSGQSWLLRSVAALRKGGCQEITVVLGAQAVAAAALLDDTEVDVVVAEDWAEGMGASLRAGLAALASGEAVVAVVHLVDLPDVTEAVVERLLESHELSPSLLARATYRGAPGHPVLIGRDHWKSVIASAHGDEGARGYLIRHSVIAVECGDLAQGVDRDTAD
ncbi:MULTISPECIES: nucleotidyltransferase family protein [Nocardioides]|uniref:NTP transferase domain-containing protein n=1 Tax=Nocardioides vastitatis TaxID=2568655 RepID=A0ABW0ZSH6_9ACTN|nr:nucleotidyltransferase family protein [Nocardioides sp.]THJ16048.1 nucleotidyltransferase family protein [Nocardioides sp.]